MYEIKQKMLEKFLKIEMLFTMKAFRSLVIVTLLWNAGGSC